MSTIAWVILGAVGVSVLWMFVIAWLVDVIAFQRKALSEAMTTVRLYRETRDQSDAQIRDLLGQNTRLARQLIEQAAGTPADAKPAVSAWPVMASLTEPGVER